MYCIWDDCNGSLYAGFQKGDQHLSINFVICQWFHNKTKASHVHALGWNVKTYSYTLILLYTLGIKVTAAWKQRLHSQHRLTGRKQSKLKAKGDRWGGGGGADELH